MDMKDIEGRYHWTGWSQFPNPLEQGYIHAPFRAGVYQLRNRRTSEYILFGEGGHLAYRMTSLLPKPYGRGTRNNEEKREYVWANIDDIDYRTVACASKHEAQKIQAELRSLNIHIFNT